MYYRNKEKYIFTTTKDKNITNKTNERRNLEKQTLNRMETFIYQID